MKQAVVGIDTSCYTTSIAAVDLEGNVIANERLMLPVPLGDGGLRQSEGVFAHVKQLPQLYTNITNALKNYRISAFCVSEKPTQEKDSYMPVFLVGKTLAQGMALAAKVPCYGTDHQQGHLTAAKIGSSLKTKSFLAIHLSGGTTQVLLVNEEKVGKVGKSLDLHGGQLVDRIGVALGLPFPAGPYLEKLAENQESKSLLPVSLSKDQLNIHLSGAEAQAFRWMKGETLSPEEIAVEVYSLLARSIARLIINHCEKWAVKEVLLAGGVASSKLFKRMLTGYLQKRAKNIKVHFSKPEYAGDNAVGVAMVGKETFLKTI